MPVLTHLQSRLPERHGEPLDKEAIVVLLAVDWNDVAEFDEIDDDVVDELREETLVQWLIENFDEVAETMSSVKASDGGLDPRLTPTVVPSPETRRVAGIFDRDEYDQGRDAYFTAAQQLADGNFLAARNGARKATEISRELLSEAQSDREKCVEDVDNVEAIERHLRALADASDMLIEAAEAGRVGRDRVAMRNYQESEKHISRASDALDELHDALR